MSGDLNVSSTKKDKKNVVKLEDSSGHSRLLLNQLAAFREDARLCDVILIAKGAQINA
ncbi:hypothetical protein GCK32_008156, partial [Trichostrongylus colubriformis]